MRYRDPVIVDPGLVVPIWAATTAASPSPTSLRMVRAPGCEAAGRLDVARLEAAIEAFARRLNDAPISIARHLHQRRHPLCRSDVQPQPLTRPTPQVLDISGRRLEQRRRPRHRRAPRRAEGAHRHQWAADHEPAGPTRSASRPRTISTSTTCCVTGGPRSFVEVARSFEDFPRHPQKLTAEVADIGPLNELRHRRSRRGAPWRATRAKRPPAASQRGGLHAFRPAGIWTQRTRGAASAAAP